MARASNRDSLPLSGDIGDAFSEFEQLLVSNSGEDAFDVAMQLLTAKLHDERETHRRKGSEQFTLEKFFKRCLMRISFLKPSSLST